MQRRNQRTPSGPEGSSGSWIYVCRRVPGHFCVLLRCMPRDWNKAYEEDDIPWDKGYASPPLVEFLERRRVGGSVLVPGCGTGHDVRLLAGQGADVTGMDIAPGAIKKAVGFRSASGERYVLGDYLNPGADTLARYDWVVEHTCLCAIEPDERIAYAVALSQVLKPGGHFLAVFYREVSDYSGDGPPHPISKEASSSLFAAFELVESFIPQKSYPSRPIGAEEVCLWRLPVTKH